MPEFQLINEKRFALNVHDVNDNTDLLDYYRWEHRVTVGYQLRRFMVMLDNLKGTLYIEEITNGNAEVIDDDQLWESIFRWVTEKGYVQVLPPLAKPPGMKTPKQKIMSTQKVKV